MPASRISTSTTQGQRRGPRWRTGGSGAGGGGGANVAGAQAAVSWLPPFAPETIAALALSSAATNSSAVCQRCAGSLASAVITTASSAGFTSGRTSAIGAAAARERCLSATDTALSPSNGTRPASISYSITPIE